MPDWACRPAIAFTGETMGGARPALRSDRIYRCGVMLCAALMIGFGGAELRAQAAPAARPLALAAKKHISAAQPLVAGQRKAPSRQTAHGQTARFKKVARGSKSARKKARAGHDKPVVVEKRAVDKPAASNDPAAILSERINNNTVSIIAGELGSTDLAIAHELSLVLDDGDNLRIMPMVGAGGSRNIRDLRFMKGADLAITQPGLLARLRQSGELDDKIVYLTKLFSEEMHLVVRADAG